jgi:hypothetical protein
VPLGAAQQRFANTVRGLRFKNMRARRANSYVDFWERFELRAIKPMFVKGAAQLARIHGLILKTVP